MQSATSKAQPSEETTRRCGCGVPLHSTLRGCADLRLSTEHQDVATEFPHMQPTWQHPLQPGLRANLSQISISKNGKKLAYLVVYLAACCSHCLGPSKIPRSVLAKSRCTRPPTGESGRTSAKSLKLPATYPCGPLSAFCTSSKSILRQGIGHAAKRIRAAKLYRRYRYIHLVKPEAHPKRWQLLYLGVGSKLLQRQGLLSSFVVIRNWINLTACGGQLQNFQPPEKPRHVWVVAVQLALVDIVPQLVSTQGQSGTSSRRRPCYTKVVQPDCQMWSHIRLQQYLNIRTIATRHFHRGRMRRLRHTCSRHDAHQ